MKLLWTIPCLALCACMADKSAEATPYQPSEPAAYNYEASPYATETVAVQTTVPVQQGYYDPASGYVAQNNYAAPAQDNATQNASQQSSNPYAMQPPVYENTSNYAWQQKENELMLKERNLIAGQQELYDRERKLADREAAFITRSKALDYKEQNIMAGKAYAPIIPMGATPVAMAPIDGTQPVYTTQALPAYPVMPAPAQAQSAQPVAPVATPAPTPTVQILPVVALPSIAQQTSQAPVPVARVDYFSETTQEIEPAFMPVDKKPCNKAKEAQNRYDSMVKPVYMQEEESSTFIILQHPIQRDLVRCPASDDVCLESYERLGYIRSNNLSRFTEQDRLPADTPSSVAGQWRENSSTPRW